MLGALVAGSTFTCVMKLHNPELLMANTSRHRLTYDTSTSTSSNHPPASNDRVLFQDISSFQIVPSKWRKLVGMALYQRARYLAKPRMMGFLLVSATKDSANANYNLTRRKWTALTNLISMRSEKKNTRQHTVKEQFQVARINADNHDMVEVVYTPPNTSPDASSTEYLVNSNETPIWKFENVMVQSLGNGVQAQNAINDNSREYVRNKPDDSPINCVPQYDWQSTSFPSCNTIHEIDPASRTHMLNPAQEPEFFLLARGGYRDVWYVENSDLPGDISGETVAMKTLLYEHPWSERNTDRHRRDAVATERLTGSPYSLNMYGYCANTGLYEFAEGGSLEDAVEDDAVWPKWTSADKMKYAYQVACAIADVHNIDHEGVPSMSHTDISMSQFVSKDSGETFQINDFNRARFLFRREDDPTEICPFDVSSNKGKFRAPEEYGTSLYQCVLAIVILLTIDDPSSHLNLSFRQPQPTSPRLLPLTITVWATFSSSC